MAKDNCLFFKLTLDFPDHAKVLPLSDAAFRCLVEAIAYCRKHLTDGKLARRYAIARWGVEVLTELSTNDPEKPSLIEREDAWYIHDYADMNDTAAEVEARRELARKAGQQGGLAKAKRAAKRTASEPLSESLPETERETEREELTTNVVSSSATPKRRPRKRIANDYMPPRTVSDAIKAETGATSDELTYQHRKFIDHFLKTGGLMADWDAAWRNWMRTAHERGDIGRMTAPTAKPSKLRALSDLAAEVREMETAQALALGS